MNRGAKETRQKFEAAGLSQNQAAGAVECDSGNWSKILRGERKPGRALAYRILARWGVSLEAWDDELPEPEQPAEPAAE